MPKPLRLCVECKWCRLPTCTRVHECGHPEFTEYSRVTGEPLYMTCVGLRGSESCCGQSGFKWEAKDG